MRDLSRDAAITMTGAMYDPTFFPDDSGFMYQPGGRMCPMSALTTGTPTAVAITGSTSPCAGSSVGLYQHTGAALEGTDYWASSAGTAAWDDGAHRATLTETPRNEVWARTRRPPSRSWPTRARASRPSATAASRSPTRATR